MADKKVRPAKQLRRGEQENLQLGRGPGMVRHPGNLLVSGAGRRDSNLLRIAAGLVHGCGVVRSYQCDLLAQDV